MENNQNISLGDFLKQLRENKGVSLADVELATSLSRSYINRLEKKNRDNPTLFCLSKLSQYYGIPFSTFAEFCECSNKDGQVQSLDFMLLNFQYLFASVEADVMFKMTLRELIKQLENYCTKLTVSRQDEANIIDTVVKLREQMLSA